METSHKSRIDLIQLETSDRLTRAVQDLVMNKFLLDKMAAEKHATMLAGDLHDGAYGPHEAGCFMRLVFPFMGVLSAEHKPFLARVPTDRTLGCSWRWRKKNLTDEEAQKVASEIQDDDALREGNIDPVHYGWIKNLGLFCPMEGKNRTDYCRESGLDSIPAKVTELVYPEPERLNAYAVRFAGADDYWVVLDNRWAQRLSYPRWALPVLEAYGVQTTKGWPTELPSMYDAAKALDQSFKFETNAFGHPDYPYQSIVDLDTISAEIEYGNEEVRCTIQDLKGISLPVRGWIAVIATSIASIIALGAIPSEWTLLKAVAGAFWLASLTALCFLFLPLFTAERKRLKAHFHLPRDRAPKRSPIRRRLG